MNTSTSNMIERSLMVSMTSATPPGDTLLELLNEKGWSRKKLAKILGRTDQWVFRLMAGKARSRLDEQTALKMEEVLGVPAHFWLTLEMNYRLALARRAFKSTKTQTKL